MVEMVGQQTHAHCRSMQTAIQCTNDNLAEASHASMEHCGGCNLSLVDAVYYDISESLRLPQMLQGYGDGAVKAGSGPSASDQQAREFSREKRQTESYIR